MNVVADEPVLRLLACLFGESGMIGECVYARLCEFNGNILGILAAVTVDDARVVAVSLPYIRNYLPECVLLGNDGIMEVFPVKTADIHLRILKSELFYDVLADNRSRGRGQGNHGNVGELLLEKA